MRTVVTVVFLLAEPVSTTRLLSPEVSPRAIRFSNRGRYGGPVSRQAVQQVRRASECVQRANYNVRFPLLSRRAVRGGSRAASLTIGIATAGQVNFLILITTGYGIFIWVRQIRSTDHFHSLRHCSALYHRR